MTSSNSASTSRGSLFVRGNPSEEPSETGAVCPDTWTPSISSRNENQNQTSSSRQVEIINETDNDQGQDNLAMQVQITNNIENTGPEIINISGDDQEPIPVVEIPAVEIMRPPRPPSSENQNQAILAPNHFLAPFRPVPPVHQMIPPTWLQRRQRIEWPVRPSPPDSFIAGFGRDGQRDPDYFREVRKLSDKGFKTLQKQAFTKVGIDGQYLCTICQDAFENGDNLIVLVCGHLFHEDCVERWLKESKSQCPICKRTVSTLSVFSTDDSDFDGDNDNTGGPAQTSLAIQV